MARFRSSARYLGALGLIIGLCVVTSALAQGQQPPPPGDGSGQGPGAGSDQGPGPKGDNERVSGVVTLVCDASTRCVGEATYTITYKTPKGKGPSKKITRKGTWPCNQQHEIRDLPVNARATIKIQWKTDNPNKKGHQKRTITVSPDPGKNRVVFSR